MITLETASLNFRFSEVHQDATCSIYFQRTLRLPDDGRTYPLPAGIGRFPMRHTDDFASRLPAAFVKRGGVIMPMWQAEAMWIGFRSSAGYPFAVKIAAGKINAVTGAPWTNGLDRDRQDYVVVPEQPWLDGYCVSRDAIRQFVAAPLGAGITAEEQLAGSAEWGGIQIVVYPMKKEAYDKLFLGLPVGFEEYRSFHAAAPAAMGLAAGGLMRQQIYENPYDFDDWDLSISSRCFVSILNAQDWQEVTGEPVPTRPISSATYVQNGIPWFDYYAGDQKVVSSSTKLAGLKSIKHFAQFGLSGKIWKNESVSAQPIINLGAEVRPKRSRQVREEEF